jgi:general secretion pathway protein A
LQSNPYVRFFSFYGLRENPFAVRPDPRCLFMTPSLQEAWEALEYGIRSHEGIILLTGEAGTGKTSLIRRLLECLRDRRTPTAYIFNSHLEPKHLYDFMLADFGVRPDPRWQGNALMCLGQWLPERCREGQVPALIVDEAQGLPLHVLEEIRMLLNLETPQERLLQIVLVGQPELEGKLNRAETRQLKQRIAVRCKTAALTPKETRDYIRARLEIAGAAGRPIFSLEAVEAVHAYSRGIPRVMNLLCEHALINAYASNLRLVPARVVDEVAREFHFDEEKYVPRIRDRVPDAFALPQQEVVITEPSARVVEAMTPLPIVQSAPPPVASAAEAITAPSLPAPVEPVPAIMAHHQPKVVVPQHAAVLRPSDDSMATTHPLTARQTIEPRVTRPRTWKVSLNSRVLATLRNNWPRTFLSPTLKSKAIERRHDLQEALHDIWSDVFDKRRLPRFKAAVSSRRESGTRRMSAAFSKAELSLRDLWRDVAPVWHRTKGYLLHWLRQPLPPQYSSTEQSIVAPSNEPGMNVIVLRWLRQPFGSSQPLHPNRRATASQNR